MYIRSSTQRWDDSKGKARRDTYSLGFFFGPGFPLGFGVDSVPTPDPRFVPGFGPAMPFFFVSSVAGSTAELAPGAGVEFVSDAFSVDEVEATSGTGVDVEDEDDLDLESLRDEGLDEKRVSKAGERCNLTILLALEFLDGRSEDIDDEGACVEFFDDMMLELWWSDRRLVDDQSECSQLGRVKGCRGDSGGAWSWRVVSRRCRDDLTSI